MGYATATSVDPARETDDRRPAPYPSACAALEEQAQLSDAPRIIGGKRPSCRAQGGRRPLTRQVRTRSPRSSGCHAVVTYIYAVEGPPHHAHRVSYETTSPAWRARAEQIAGTRSAKARTSPWPTTRTIRRWPCSSPRASAAAASPARGGALRAAANLSLRGAWRRSGRCGQWRGAALRHRTPESGAQQSGAGRSSATPRPVAPRSSWLRHAVGDDLRSERSFAALAIPVGAFVRGPPRRRPVHPAPGGRALSLVAPGYAFADASDGSGRTSCQIGHVCARASSMASMTPRITSRITSVRTSRRACAPQPGPGGQESR